MYSLAESQDRVGNDPHLVSVDAERQARKEGTLLGAAVPDQKGATPVGGRTLTPRQLMDRLQIGETRVYWELQYGFLSDIAFRLGRQWRVGEAALERLLEQHDGDSR